MNSKKKTVITIKSRSRKEQAIRNVAELFHRHHSNELEFSSHRVLCYTVCGDGSIFRYDPMIRSIKQFTMVYPSLLPEEATGMDLDYRKALVGVANGYGGLAYVIDEATAVLIRRAIYEYVLANLEERFQDKIG